MPKDYDIKQKLVSKQRYGKEKVKWNSFFLTLIVLKDNWLSKSKYSSSVLCVYNICKCKLYAYIVQRIGVRNWEHYTVGSPYTIHEMVYYLKADPD